MGAYMQCMAYFPIATGFMCKMFMKSTTAFINFLAIKTINLMLMMAKIRISYNWHHPTCCVDKQTLSGVSVIYSIFWSKRKTDWPNGVSKLDDAL
jgi:hypothetical protein